MGLMDILFAVGEPILRALDTEKNDGKAFNAIDSKIGEIGDNYNRKVNDVESYKKRFQGYTNNRLAEIAKDGNKSFEMRTAAMQVLKEKGAFNK